MTRWMQVTLALLLAAPGPAAAEMIYRGTRELGLSGLLDLDTVDDATVQADATFGQFVYDYWELGVGAGLAISDSQSQFRGRLFTEYNFEINTTVLPYLGASIGVVAADVEYEDIEGNDVAFTAGGELGLKGFVTEDAALFGAIEMLWASDDVFVVSDGVDDTDVRLKLGLRYFF